jgi:hypothetical protein
MALREPTERLTIVKAESLIRESAFEVSGYVLLDPKTGNRAIVEMAAVRHLTNNEMWALMHPVHDVYDASPHPIMWREKLYFLHKCPFCGAGEFHVRELGRMWTGQRMSEPVSIEIIHHCTKIEGQPLRAIVRAGRDMQAAVDMWNLRA